jgi:hypothetical protein
MPIDRSVIGAGHEIRPADCVQGFSEAAQRLPCPIAAGAIMRFRELDQIACDRAYGHFSDQSGTNPDVDPR